jgi:small subunit ribosomal protein S17e
MVIFKTSRRFHIRTKAGLSWWFGMGKVRIEMVKRISMELVDRYERSLTTEFEQNKQFLKEIGLDVSKKLRNKIAGYVTRLMKIEEVTEL